MEKTSDIVEILKALFPIVLIICGVLPFLLYGRYRQIHENFVQILAVSLFVPSVIYCMSTGLISENGGVGLLGSMIGYVFGATLGRKSKNDSE